MTEVVFIRRATLLALAAGLGASLCPSAALAASTEIRVAKDPNCGCCGAWIEVIEREGFRATVDLLDYDALQAHKVKSGVPAEMMTCHTAHV